MRHPKQLPLPALLLVLVMTVEVALAAGLTCQGTASCCCAPAASGMDMAAGMAPECCTGGAPRSCDLEKAPPADLLYLTAPVVDHGDVFAAAPGGVVSADPEATVRPGVLRTAARPGGNGVPLYLQFQSFLC